MMEPLTINRRTFFFLGLGLMAGKSLYSPRTILYRPTLRQITFFNDISKVEKGIDWGKSFQVHSRLYDILSKGEIHLVSTYEPHHPRAFGMITNIEEVKI